MRGERLRVAVNFDQHEEGWDVGLLNDVETQAARLLHAVAGVFDGGALEIVEVLRFDVNIHVQDVHNTIIQLCLEGRA